jgi:hypothetical protein
VEKIGTSCRAVSSSLDTEIVVREIPILLQLHIKVSVGILASNNEKSVDREVGRVILTEPKKITNIRRSIRRPK